MDKINEADIPELWGPSCQYCKTQRQWGEDHETEIMRRARKLCANPLFPEIVYSGLDLLDHAHATPKDQIRLLVKLHDRTNCECLDKIAAEVDRRVHTAPESLPGSSTLNNRADKSDIPAFSPLDLANFVRNRRSRQTRH